MSQETITLRMNKNNWELFNRIALLSENGHRTNQAVIESLLRVGMDQLALSESKIRSNANDIIVNQILASDVLGTCMLCLGRDPTGKTAEVEPPTVNHDCVGLPFVRPQEVIQ